MTPRATVLIPTHNHGAQLRYSIASALRQTVHEVEVFVVGDGVDEPTRAAALSMAAADERVRFFDMPKGARHGEVNRHTALKSARGEIICYLSDDDLYLPTHIETMLDLLKEADFTHVTPLLAEPSGLIALYGGHLASAGVVERMQGKWNFIPLSCAGHTRSLYERLPFGWRAAPADVWTDLHFWRQILAAKECRAVSSTRTTVLTLPSPLRAGWTIERRAEELASWAARLEEPGFEIALAARALEFCSRESYERSVWIDKLLAERGELCQAITERDATIRTLCERAETAMAETRQMEREYEVRLSHMRDQAAAAKASNEQAAARFASETEAIRSDAFATYAQFERQLTEANLAHRECDRHIAELETSLNDIQSTLTWRLRKRLVKLPFIVPAIRAIARLGSRRPAR